MLCHTLHCCKCYKKKRTKRQLVVAALTLTIVWPSKPPPCLPMQHVCSQIKPGTSSPRSNYAGRTRACLGSLGHQKQPPLTHLPFMIISENLTPGNVHPVPCHCKPQLVIPVFMAKVITISRSCNRVPHDKMAVTGMQWPSMYLLS